MFKKIKIFIFASLVLLLSPVLLYLYLFSVNVPEQESIKWGVNFSLTQAQHLELDWKETYLAILQDLKAKNVKLHIPWDRLENTKDVYNFDDTDWLIQEAEKNGADVIYVVGLKTGRWPECHLPEWVGNLPKEEQQSQLLKYVAETVLKYKNSKSITAWQVENEPLFKFGECPSWYYKNKEFLKREVALVKSLDPERPVIISDSGEQSLWLSAAKIGDVVGVTTYRRVWTHITGNIGFYFKFPIPPPAYWIRAQMVKKIYNKEVIGIELQAEPWTQKLFQDVSLQDQEKTMNLEKFKENVEYAKKTGLGTFYLWGVEWWVWLKDMQNKPEIWNEAKNLFN